MNNLLDMLSKAAEEAVDAAQGHNSSSNESKDIKPDMLYQEPVRQSKRITPLKPISLSAAPPKQEAVTMVGLTPISASSETVTRVALTPIAPPPGYSGGNQEADSSSHGAPQSYNEAFSELDSELDEQVQDISPMDAELDDDDGFSIDLDLEDFNQDLMDAEDVELSEDEADKTHPAEAFTHSQNQAMLDYANALKERIYALENQLKATQKNYEAAENKASQLQEKLARAAADFDNYRKRVNRDQDQFKAQAKEKIISDFLGVMDNFERAIQHAQVSQNFDNLLHGVELTAKQFTQALAKQGCQSFESLGQTFDPNYHDVLSRVESTEIPHNTVVQEHLKGYLMNDRLLRPALVVVSQHPEEQSENSITEQDSEPSEEQDESLKE